MPAEIQTSGGLERELTYGNYQSAAKYRGKALRQAANVVIIGRAIVVLVAQAKKIAGLWVLPVGVVDEKENLRVLYRLTFRGRVTVRKGDGL